jgi:hypothetical protein
MEIYYLEDLGVDGRIVLKWTFRNIGWGGTDYIAAAQGRDRWRVLQ